ncbi:MAG: aminotransferase [Novosphingobium sp.]|nr:aminotransferase [Novosphingobium sp.]
MHAVSRIHPIYDKMETTIFETMSGLARELGAINLGQGFPDDHGPSDVIEAAVRALREESNQYPPGAGVPELREAVADFYARRQGLAFARDNVVVTSGATEAIAACVLALVQPGDEVILFQPAYDAYAPMVRRAGGVPVSVYLQPPEWRYEAQALEAAITERTRVVMFNDPLNPAGSVANEAELAMIARACVNHDLIAVCDEVWETVRFDGISHRSLMDFPGMADRAVKIGSAGKIFGLTGWKIGWMCGGDVLAPALARAHQFLTYATAAPLQRAVTVGLGYSDQWFADLCDNWAASRELLKSGLTDAGFAVLPNAATWFLCVDLLASGISLDDRTFSERAVREAGVATVPVSALIEGDGARHIVRFCFTKPDAMLDEAVERLGRLRARLVA